MDADLAASRCEQRPADVKMYANLFHGIASHCGSTGMANSYMQMRQPVCGSGAC